MTCPVCGKPVDPLRAPAVGVRDGKVVSYCSREHALEAETKPTVVAKPRASTDPAFRIPQADQQKKKRTPNAGIATPSSTYDSGPVIEIVHEPASGVVTSAPDARDARISEPRISRSQTSGAIQIADTGRIDDYVSADDEDAPHRRRGWIAILVVVVLGGGAFAAYELGYLDSLVKQDSQAATPQVAPVPGKEAVVVADAAPAPPTPEAAIARAKEVLSTMMTTSSPRIVRHAAAALARTGDPAALAALTAALANETKDPAKTSITTKIELLYDLARGGDKKSAAGLVADLVDQNRDHRIDAATRLRQLGDKRAPDALAQYLDYPQFHIGVAKQLALAADPRGIKVFQAVHADPKASADDKAIATIALGYAGQADVMPELHQLLEDGHFNADAAAALVNVHDAKARPTLIKQLQVSALRVQAARSLRHLDAAPDPALFAPLLAELATPQDTDVQVGAAETLLLLAGPVEWSKYE